VLIWLWILPYSVSMVLTFILQKRHRVDYDFDAEKLERMMAATGRGFNLELGGRVGQETVPSPSGQPKSRDSLGSVHPMEVLILDSSSEVEVLGEMVFPEDASVIIPPTEVHVVVAPHSEPSLGPE